MSGARRYFIPLSFTWANSEGDIDVFSITSIADDKPVELVGFILSQSSEVGDAQEENLRLILKRGTATVTAGSGGSSVTPVPVKRSDPAAGFTCRIHDTTIATTSGAFTTLGEFAWNVRNSPCPFMFDEDADRPDAIQGEGLVLTCPQTIADDATVQITVIVDERG